MYWKDNPYRTILMDTDFSNAVKSGDLLIKEVPIDVDDLVDEDATEEERDLSRKRRHIAVYNRERKKLDIADL